MIDTGIGIAPEVHAKIFQPFFQADNSMRRRFAGSGLGLAISKHLATLMKGDLTFESQLGHGTAFKLRLPLRPAPGARPATPPPVSGEPAIVVVETNEACRRVLERRLSSWGYTVRAFADSESAIAAAADDEALRDRQLLFLVDGKAPRDVLSQLESRRDAKVVRMGYERPLPDAHYLRKPVRDSQLRRVIEELAGGVASRPAPTPVPRKRVPVTNRNLNILVAEDNPTNQLVIRRYLVHSRNALTIFLADRECRKVLGARKSRSWKTGSWQLRPSADLRTI